MPNLRDDLKPAHNHLDGDECLEGCPARWGQANILYMKQPTWEWCFNGDWHSLKFRVFSAPNWFHRFLQKWMLGIHWRPVEG